MKLWVLSDTWPDVTKREQEIATANHTTLEAASIPSGPKDFAVGATVMPIDLLWMRGPGRVDAVDDNGAVWVVYGQRPNAHPSDPKTVRCFSPWHELRILNGGER